MEVKDSKCVVCICGENIFRCYFPRSFGVPFHILIVPYKVLSRLSKEESKQSISCLPCHLGSLSGKYHMSYAEKEAQGWAYILRV